MFNPDHLKILRQGIEVWNKWRSEEKSPDLFPDLQGVNISNAKLQQINFGFTILTDADARGANLSSAYMSYGIMDNANFGDALLIYTNFTDSDLHKASFVGADLNSAYFRGANLEGVDFSGARLYGTRFIDTKLDGAKFNDAELGGTIFSRSDLSKVKGLHSCEHFSPSIIDTTTLALSGMLPIKFLRGCGVPESFITHLPALITSDEPIQFYKCFISFTESDDLFSERLYNDLQGAGVRCWRWKEDAKWGKPLMRSIDEAVRVYDKLIVICSEQSLNSPAVIREIERALQKEDDLARQGGEGEVLFPIRLDDYIFAGWNHHRKADVIAKNVGDVRLWHDPEKYKKAFDRLLRDLKAEGKDS